MVDLAVGHVSALKKLEENCGCKVRLSWDFNEELNWKQNHQASTSCKRDKSMSKKLIEVHKCLSN